MGYKIVFLDVDGTLFSHKTKSVPESTLKALQEAKKNGIIICLATGRSNALTAETGIFEKFTFDYSTVCNGTLVLDNKNNVIFAHPIDLEAIHQIIKITNDNNFNIAFVTKDEFYRLNDNTEIVEKGYGPLGIKTPEKKQYNDEDCYMVNLFWEPDKIASLFKQVSSTVRYSGFNDYGYDVIPTGFSKANGIEALISYLHIDRKDVIAIGDGHNDAEMIEYAGLGIAMGNAIDKVKKVADYITTDIDHDGIYNAFKYAGII